MGPILKVHRVSQGWLMPLPLKPFCLSAVCDTGLSAVHPLTIHLIKTGPRLSPPALSTVQSCSAIRP